jgi:Flp pilus assembly pilin Flp
MGLGPGTGTAGPGLIAAGIAVAIIATVLALGTNLNTTLSTFSTALK